MRTTEIEDILFPVELRPLHYLNEQGNRLNVASHQVVVNKSSGGQLGVVGSGYRLVTNEEALGFAKNCATQLFGTSHDKLEVFNVISPQRKSYCHIDLVHQGFEVNILKSELYLPFIRVTNSYNATRALRFDIGYCRKLCSNGVIFEKQSIEFRFTHSRSGIPQQPNFRIAKGQLEDLKKSFETDAERLHAFNLPEVLLVPMVFSALQLQLPRSAEEFEKNKAEFYTPLKNDVERLVRCYAGSLGLNGYAVFNAATDFATHPPEIRGMRRMPHAMQARLGEWAHEFGQTVSEDPKVDLLGYLGEYATVSGWN